MTRPQQPRATHSNTSGRSAVSFAVAALVLLFMAILVQPAKALEGDDGVFDPSSIVRVGNVYHIFCDGQGIVHKESTDLVNWTTVGSVFGSGAGPAWIQTYAPGFAGYFWAPEIANINGKYYCYYACSNYLGSPQQAIGCAVSTDLVHWIDQGMVIYANSSTPYGAIDPSVCQDTSGAYWLTWGSWRNGIYDCQVDPQTGKLIGTAYNNIVHIAVSGGNPTDSEASKMVYHDGYYYCFFNHGTCCNGITSTYQIWVARSTTPNGAFSQYQLFIAGSNPVYAPGQFGYFADVDGTEYCTYHYDDGNSNGYPRLAIDKIAWSGGWPLDLPNWIPTGEYWVANSSSHQAWIDGTGASLQPLTQSPYTSAANQKFQFTNVGWNRYEITSINSGLAIDCFDCNNTDGTPLDVYSFWGGTCQLYNIFRSTATTYVISTYNGGGNGTDVIEYPGSSTVSGTQLDLWSYNGRANQKWIISRP